MRTMFVLLALLLALPAAAQAAPDRVVLAGGTHVLAGETVGDVFVIDGPVVVDGRVTGDLVSVSDPVRISGTVEGDVTAVSAPVIAGPRATIGGDLLYGDEKPVLARGARVEGKVSDEGWNDFGGAPWGFVSHVAFWLAASVSSLALGFLLLWLAPGAIGRSTELLRRRSGAVALTGLLLVIGLPIAAVLMVVTLIGLPLGIALLLALLPLGAVGYVTAMHMLGRVVAPKATPAVAFLAGWGMLRAAAFIPAVGPPLWAVAMMLGLGALLLALWESRPARAVPAGGPEAPLRPAALH
ncbi:MAG: polymer-forming cytoskeletal protein [Solirubrobacterales bacterium]|nr:polymer-forming cytoskeletal protein [Solirubrobacterales bacterium]